MYDTVVLCGSFSRCTAATHFGTPPKMTIFLLTDAWQCIPAVRYLSAVVCWKIYIVTTKTLRIPMIQYAFSKSCLSLNGIGFVPKGTQWFRAAPKTVKHTEDVNQACTKFIRPLWRSSGVRVWETPDPTRSSENHKQRTWRYAGAGCGKDKLQSSTENWVRIECFGSWLRDAMGPLLCPSETELDRNAGEQIDGFAQFTPLGGDKADGKIRMMREWVWMCGLDETKNKITHM